MNKLKSNISKFFDGIDKKTEAGVYAVANKGLAMALTYTPNDKGNLINNVIGPLITSKKDEVKGTVGFDAKYAFYVHNKTGKLKGLPRANGNGYYWSPDAEPRFLEKGFKEIESEIPKILKAVYETN